MNLRRGRAGERAAERELRRRGLILLERNVRAGRGEIDLVALDGGTIVIVEVKARSPAALETPEEAVDRRKRRSLILAARSFLARKRLLHLPRRYDVAAVLLDDRGRAAGIRWTKAAFDETGIE